MPLTPSITITTQVYPPEVHPTAVMVKELAEYLVQAGWDVSVCAGWPIHPGGRLYAGWNKKFFSKLVSNNVKVLRAWHFTNDRRSILIRLLVYSSQSLSMAACALMTRRPDVLLVYGPPLVGPILGIMISFIRRTRMINVIYDIYPDIVIETGKIRNPLLVWASRLLEKFQYRGSDLTVVLSEGFRQTLINKGMRADKVSVVPLWLDQDEIRVLPRENDWRKEVGIAEEAFVVLYAGTIGVISGASMVADTAAMIPVEENIEFIFVGAGEELIRLKSRAKALNLRNMRFLPFQARERLSEVLATADVGLVTLSRGRGRTSVPSKMLGYIAAARPVVACVDAGSDTALDVIKGGFGVVIDPEDPRALADRLVVIKRDSEQRKKMGLNARAYFEYRYSKRHILGWYREVISSMAGHST